MHSKPWKIHCRLSRTDPQNRSSPSLTATSSPQYDCYCYCYGSCFCFGTDDDDDDDDLSLCTDHYVSDMHFVKMVLYPGSIFLYTPDRWDWLRKENLTESNWRATVSVVTAMLTEAHLVLQTSSTAVSVWMDVCDICSLYCVLSSSLHRLYVRCERFSSLRLWV